MRRRRRIHDLEQRLATCRVIRMAHVETMTKALKTLALADQDDVAVIEAMERLRAGVIVNGMWSEGGGISPVDLNQERPARG